MKTRKPIRAVFSLLLAAALLCGSLPTATAVYIPGNVVTLPDGGTYPIAEFRQEGDFDVYYLNKEGTRSTTAPTDSTYGVSIRRIREDYLGKSAAHLYIPDTYLGYPVVRLEKADSRNHYLGIRIPATVREIVDPTFSNCLYLEWIEVAEGNPDFYSVDGVLYKGNAQSSLTHLVCYPQGKKDESFTSFAGARYIDDKAFYGNAYLKTLTIAVGRNSLTVGTIRNCSALETLIFGEGPLFLNNCFVENCPALKTVHFSQTNELLPDSLQISGAADLTVCSAVFSHVLQQTAQNEGFAYSVCGDAHTYAQQDIVSPELPDSWIEEIADESLFWFSPCFQTDEQGSYVCDEYGAPVRIGYTVLGLTCRIDAPARATIPATHAGLPVLEIGNSFSTSFDKLVAVHIPSTVQKIAPGAFQCAFASEPTFGEITVDEDSPFFKVVNGVLFTADGKELVVYPAAKESTVYTIPTGTQRLSDSALSWSPNLQQINVPYTFTDGRLAETLDTAQNLKAVHVASANPALSCDSSGVLYNKDKTTLLFYPPYGPADYTLPQSVTEIADRSLSSKTLRTLRIADDAAQTPIANLSACIYQISGMLCLHIPASVTTIRFTGRSGGVRICCLTRASQAAAYAAANSIPFYICNADHTELRAPTDDDPPAPVLIAENTFDYSYLSEQDENGVAQITGVCIHGLLQTPVDPFVLTIPAEYRGLPVRKVDFTAAWSKAHSAKVTKLSLPATVESLEGVCDAAFYTERYFCNLSQITVDDTNPFLRSVDGVLFDKAMTTLLLYPASKADTSYAIPDGVVTVAGGYVFGVNLTIRSLTLPASFTGGTNNAWFNAFRMLRKLESYTVDPDNPKFASDDCGVLFTADMTEMILYPQAAPADVYTIPASVEEFYSSYTFYQPEHLRVLCIADGAIQTPYGQISTTAPTYVHIPSSVIYVNFTSITKTYQTICSDSVDCRAAAFAKQNGIPFALCNEDHTQFTAVNPDDVPVYPVRFRFITEKDEAGVTRCTGVCVRGPSGAVTDEPYTLTIPAACYGLPVREINFNAWSQEELAGVARIDIPETVETLTGFPVNVAANCTSLACITVDADNPYLAADDGVLFNGDKTELIWYPAGKKDASYAIPEGVQGIFRAESFSSNTYLQHLTLPASFTQFGTYTSRCFSGLWNLKRFTVDARNPQYSSDENGILYNADKSILYIYPCAAEAEIFTIPASVKGFGFYQPVYGPRYLRVLCIADGMSWTPSLSIRKMDALQYVHIPSSKTTIPSGYAKLDKSVTICSDAADCAAAAFAQENGYVFVVCNGHDAPVTPDNPDDPPAPPAGPVTLTVSGGTARPGELVQVTVDLTKNTGVVALRMHLGYDPSVLTLTGVQDGGLLETASFVAGRDLSAVPYTVLWEDALTHENHTATGTLVTFTFRVSENAAADTTPVTLTVDENSTYDVDLENVACAVTNGAVTVVTRIAGDANGDGLVDLKDVVLLRRCLAGGWNVTILTDNADVDGDGTLSLKDSTLLSRYLSGGWNVTLR